MSYSAPTLNQCAACCTDSPEVNSQTPEAKASLPTILFGDCVVGGRWDSGGSQAVAHLGADLGRGHAGLCRLGVRWC